jgi:hypothetical protein
MAAGRRRKVGAVRQIGGRIAPQHHKGVMSQVVASRFPCPVCGSGKLRVTTSGQEGEVCRQTREQRRRRRTALRCTAAGRTVSWLVKERSREVGLMLSRYAVWQAPSVPTRCRRAARPWTGCVFTWMRCMSWMRSLSAATRQGLGQSGGDHRAAGGRVPSAPVR